MSLIVEGLSAAWLPCSLILLVPGTALALAARASLLPALSGFAVASTALAWLRFSDRGGNWPIGVAAVAVAVAAVVLLAPPLISEDLTALGAGVLAGGASAELWEPCVGAELGLLLNALPDQGGGGLGRMALYMAGVLTPLVVVAAVLKLLPEWIRDWVEGSLAVLGGAILSVIAIATAVGFHDEVVGQLFRWSLA